MERQTLAIGKHDVLILRPMAGERSPARVFVEAKVKTNTLHVLWRIRDELEVHSGRLIAPRTVVRSAVRIYSSTYGRIA